MTYMEPEDDLEVYDGPPDFPNSQAGKDGEQDDLAVDEDE